MTQEIIHCPRCQSQEISRNGLNSSGKQSYMCRDCGRRFVLEPQWTPLSEKQKSLIACLLLERISLTGIARVMDRSEDCIQRYVNQRMDNVVQQVEVTKKEKKPLTVQMDELWSFVDNKGNKQWVWLALDAQTRKIVGVYIGDRSAKAAKKLWESMPGVYRQCAVIYTDHYDSYPPVLPSKRHRAVGKESGCTNYIERFNCTLRQRVSRLVRKSLSFSKKLENHVAAIWNFVHHYNEQLRLKQLRSASFSPSCA